MLHHVPQSFLNQRTEGGTGFVRKLPGTTEQFVVDVDGGFHMGSHIMEYGYMGQ